MRYNLHTHTFRCRHAQGSDREYVEAAIKAGMKVLGFTDHCPQFFPTDYYSTFRMFPEDAADYAESVRALAKEYRDDIQILLGFETEYYPEIFGELLRLVRQLGCDYLIMGQHFIENEYDRPSFYGSSPSRDDIDRYIMQTLEGSLELARAGYRLFCRRYDWRLPVRALTIRGINPISESAPVQLDIFNDYVPRRKQKDLDDTIDDIRRRFGNRAIFNACLMGDLHMANDRCETVPMPSPMYQ